jgi:hypothetical protein
MREAAGESPSRMLSGDRSSTLLHFLDEREIYTGVVQDAADICVG